MKNAGPLTVPVLETERLILKNVTLADAPAYERHFVDYEVIRHLGRIVPWPYPKGGVIDYLQNEILASHPDKELWVWGLFLKEDPETLIGMISLWRPGRPEHRGFWLGRAFWGRGLMSEAVVPVMDYAFDKLGFEKILFNNALGNIRSRRIKEKTGARLLYTEVAEFVDPLYSEREVWQLTKSDWKSIRKDCP